MLHRSSLAVLTCFPARKFEDHYSEVLYVHGQGRIQKVKLGGTTRAVGTRIEAGVGSGRGPGGGKVWGAPQKFVSNFHLKWCILTHFSVCF